MLRDLEALLLEIEDPASREYMREAVRSYHGGAHRAAVVVAVAAGMDDLRRKLEQLATSGAPPQAVKDGHAEVDRKYRQQDAFEATLLDHALKVDLITPAEEKKLRTLLQTRHLCGHPSGHAGSPEEARATITGVIDLVMSRPALLGMTAVTDLLGRMEQKTFFPRDDHETARDVMRKELEVVNPTHYPALIARMVDAAVALLDAKAGATGLLLLAGPQAIALRQVLAALRALMGEGAIRGEVWRRVNRLVDHADGTNAALTVLSGEPGAGLQEAAPLHRMRAMALLRRNITNETAYSTVARWYTANVLTDEEIAEFATAIQAAALSGKPSASLTALVFAVPWAGAAPHYIDRLVADAASGTFATANTAITTMQALTAEQAAATTREQQVAYLLNVASNTDEPYPSFAAKGLRQDGLGPRQDFIDAVQEQLADEPTKALTRYAPVLHEMLSKSGRGDVAATLRAAAADALANDALGRFDKEALSTWLDAESSASETEIE